MSWITFWIETLKTASLIWAAQLENGGPCLTVNFPVIKLDDCIQLFTEQPVHRTLFKKCVHPVEMSM